MVFAEIQKPGDFAVPSQKAANEDRKKGPDLILDTLAGIFSPIMPIIAGAGMVKVLLSILVLFELIDKTGNLYYFLRFIADASCYFLPVFLAASAAGKSYRRDSGFRRPGCRRSR